MGWKGMVMAGAALGALAAWGTTGPRRFRQRSLAGDVVLIVGGSRGLGFCLARELAAEGCRLAIVARDPDTLVRAQARLEGEFAGAEVYVLPCDVTDPRAVEEAVEAVVAHYDRLDGLINVAGTIQVGPLSQMAPADFEAEMRQNCFGAIRMAYAALPALKARRRGWIVNIVSSGGRIAVPHLLPYDCSKFALRGFSEGLSEELAREGVAVTTVLPGLMRTGSPVHAKFKAYAPGEFAWFGAADSLPGLSLAPPAAARRIVKAIRLGEREITLGWVAKLGGVAHDLLPGATIAALEVLDRLLPHRRAEEAGGPGPDVEGRHLGRTAVGPLVRAIERYGERYNQAPARVPERS